jgi:dihydrodipicolinate synthase/N-acetylneuraminate lyase
MTRLEKKYAGVIVPMVTPFDEKGKIDFVAAERITEYLIANGTTPFILGTTGECSSIPDELRLAFVEKVVKAAAGRLLTYAGIAANCFQTSVTLARQYFDAGIDVVVAHLPSYYPLNSDHMLRYFGSLADECPGPVILYNIPKTTHHSIPLKVVEKLSHHPNIWGLKDSERDLARLEQAITMWKNRTDFSYLIGWAAQAENGLAQGADGLVPSTGNFVPNIYQKLYNAVLEGDFSTSELYQQKSSDISLIYQKDLLLSETIPALKIIMNYLGLCGPNVLPPLLESSQKVRQKIIEQVEKSELKMS